MAYLEGVKTGYATGGGNPFSVVIKRVREAQERKIAERREDEKDLRELQQVFQTLGKKYEYDKALAEEESRQKFALEGEKTKQEAFYKDYEIAAPEEQATDFKGTPFESVAGQGRFKRKPLQQQGVFLVDPRNPEGGIQQVATVPKGSKVVQQPKSLEDIATEAEVGKIGELKPNLDRANESIQQLKKLYQKGDISKSVKKGDVLGGLKERGAGVFQGLVAKAGGNPELQQYLKLRKAFASLVTKGGLLEAGVLTNPDIERALGALPTTGSTKEEEELGWQVLDEIMTSAQKRFETLIKSGKVMESNKESDSEYQNYLQSIGQ